MVEHYCMDIMRELEKYELGVLNLCRDETQREKLRKKLEKRSKPLDPYELKKLESKIEKING